MILLVVGAMMIAGSVFPSATPASWMSPESFHLELGAEQAEIESRFSERGWELEEGKGYGELVHEYDNGRTLSLSFVDGVLVSIRFELASFPPETREAFEELKDVFTERFGKGEEMGVERALSFSGETMSAHLVLLDRLDGTADRSPVEVVVARYFVRP